MDFFKTLLDAFEKVLNLARALANLPKETRDELRKSFDETFTLLDTSLNMVIIRLGEILRITNEQEFAREVGQLTYDASWTKAEREFRLCKSLRHAVDETTRLRSRILHYISVKDWDDMHFQMDTILLNEDKLGIYIAGKFGAFFNMVNDQGIQKTRDALADMQASLNAERRRLINMEIELYNNF